MERKLPKKREDSQYKGGGVTFERGVFEELHTMTYDSAYIYIYIYIYILYAYIYICIYIYLYITSKTFTVNVKVYK